jgi:hypothetical protein
MQKKILMAVDDSIQSGQAVACAGCSAALI